MLNQIQLSKLEEDLSVELSENLLHIISKLNRENTLMDFLDLIGLRELVEENEYRPFKKGKIIIVGQSEISKDTILSTAKNLGIEKTRIEMCLTYDDASRYDFGKTQYNPQYSLILVGPMGHSGPSKEDYSSVITALENKEGYPPIIRLGTNSLKITKTGIKTAFLEAMQQDLITAY